METGVGSDPDTDPKYVAESKASAETCDENAVKPCHECEILGVKSGQWKDSDDKCKANLNTFSVYSVGDFISERLKIVHLTSCMYYLWQ